MAAMIYCRAQPARGAYSGCNVRAQSRVQCAQTPPARLSLTNHRPCGIKNDFNYLLDPPPWQKSDRGPSPPSYARSERIRMSGTRPRSGRTMSEFRHNLIITVSDQNQNCKGTQSMITYSLCIPIIFNFHHWFLDSHLNLSWEFFQKQRGRWKLESRITMVVWVAVFFYW